MILAHTPTPPEQVVSRVLLSDISWMTYENLLREVGDRPVHLTYDGGLLEIEMPSLKHERLKTFIAQLIETFVVEKGLDYLPAGSATWRSHARYKGIEPDESYYIGNVSHIEEIDQIDLDRDPPPDLAVEVDLTSSSIDKQAIYAALGIAELWRVTEQEVRFLLLGSDGNYAEAA